MFGIVHVQIKLLHKQLAFIQALVPSDQSWEAEQRVQSDLLEALKREECIWKQKSRITWLTTFDLNTRYFHLSTIIRQRRNSMEAMKNGKGMWLTGRYAIGEHIVDYFNSRQNLWLAVGILVLLFSR